MMQNEKTTKSARAPAATTSVAETARAVADREKETVSARAALEAARTDEAAAAAAYQDEMSEPRMSAWRAASEKRDRCERQLAAHQGREQRAREAHAAAQRSEDEAELAKLEREGDPDAVESELDALIVDFAVATHRELYARSRTALEKASAQREIVAKARELAAKLGRASRLREVRADDARVRAGVAVAMAAEAEGRAEVPCELIVTPIRAAFIWADVETSDGAQKRQSENPLCSAEQFEAARRRLKKEGS